jgi:hypothetical protein
MGVLLSMVVRLAALFYTATTGAALYRVLTDGPSGLTPLQAGIVAAGAALVFQLGLLLAPSAVARGSRARAAAAALMLPGLVLLSAILIGGLQRWPRAISVVAVAAIGVMIYAGQYAVLWRARQMRKGSPEPAV